MRNIRLILVVALVASVVATLFAAEDAPAGARATLQRIQTLRKQHPGDGVLVFYESVVRISLGERQPGFDLLRSLKGRNLGLIPAHRTGFDAVWSDAEFQRIRKELADQETKTPDAPVAFRLKDPKLIPEGIAYDSKADRFFIGSVAQHKIISSDRQGNAADFSTPADKLDAVLGIAVDAQHQQLFAVSTNGFEEAAKTERRNAVVSYDLTSGRLANRFAAPEAIQLNDLTIAPDGTLYVTDSETGTLFRKKPDETALTRFSETGALRGANGITLSGDGILYVTLSTGIARVDATTGEPTRLPQPDNIVTGGIDGLYWYKGDLIGIQNSTNPGRVVRIALSGQGQRITGLTVLQSHHHPEFDEPTTGAIGNSVFYVIANSYVGDYQPDGTIKDAADLKGTTIIAVPLRR